MSFIPKTWVDDQIVYAEDMNRIEQGIAETDVLLREKVNPNLLDNWYFANPINQRDGYVVPPGVAYYQMDTTTQVGTTDEYYKALADPVNWQIEIDGTRYWVDRNTAVRGYTGVGYGIDRWYLNLSSSTAGGIQILDDCIQFIANGGSRIIEQRIEGLEDISGKTITLSVLVDTFGLVSVTTALGSIKFKYFNGSTSSDGYMSVEQKTSGIVSIVIGSNDTARKVYAAKFELGSQQTLAHQDENGNWQLNAIPNYHEEFLKCIQSTADPTDEYANKVIYSTGNKPTYSDVGAAPEGYGLGGYAKQLTSADDLNVIWESGYYSWHSSSMPKNIPEIRGLVVDVFIMHVWGHHETAYYQEIIPITDGESYNCSNNNKLVRSRYGDATTIKGWDWVNPPMQLGVEYRTTERYRDKPVYAQLFSVGACSAGSEVNLYKGVGTLNTDKVVSYCGYAADRALPYFVKDTTYNIMLAVQKIEGTYDLAIGLATGTSVSFTESHVIVKYTKTTD